MAHDCHLAVIPLDGFFFKDGRGWYASASGHGRSLDWPFPSTMRGALRTVFGRHLEASSGRVLRPSEWPTVTAGVTLGASLALRRKLGEPWAEAHRMWPVPADARYVAGAKDIERLQPEPAEVPTLGRDDGADADAREALFRPRAEPGKPTGAPRWWPERDFVAWLAEGRVRAHDETAKPALDLPRRVDVRVRVDQGTLTAADEALFSTETLETLTGVGDDLRQWAIGLAASLPEHRPLWSIPWTLGSDRRLALAEEVPAALFHAPASLVQGKGAAGLRVFVVAPTCFERGWLPSEFAAVGREYRGRLPGISDELVLRAAFVRRPLHASGWDMASCHPKETLRLVPPGSVYFFEKTRRSGSFEAGELASLWLARWGCRTDEGFGRVVAGRWTPTHV